MLIMKTISLFVAGVVLFGARIAFAQAYYSNPVSAQPLYIGSCVSISRELTTGSRGTDVLELQKFIVSRNYPGGGSWMLTSYYGAATRAGVINFQIDKHLQQTGIMDAQTRAALSQFTCGYGSPVQPIYPSTPNYSVTNPWYNFNNYSYGLPTGQAGNNYTGNCSSVYGSSSCQCGWYTVAGQNYFNNCGTTANTGALSVSYLSPNSGGVGTSVTVFGTGFSSTNNSVRFGNGIIANLSSIDGRSLSFVVPATLSGYGSSQVTPGVYNVSVTNSSGASSNNLQFVVNSYGNNSSAPSISNVSSPTSLALNTTGTWIVSFNNPSSYNYSNISVSWGDPVYGAYAVAPQQIYGTGSQQATFTHAYSQTGTYTITFTVSNSAGSNTSTVTVQVGTSQSGAPVITSISPTYGAVGTQIVLTGTGFTGDNTVHFGNGGKMHVTSMSGNYIYFTVPQYLSPCDVSSNGSVCAQYLQQVTPGQYQVYVTAGGNNSNSITFNVQ